MGAILRLSSDIEIAKGDPKRLESALNKKENRKKLNDYIKHVLLDEVSETAEADDENAGGYVHIHDMAGGQCQICVRESMTEILPTFD